MKQFTKETLFDKGIDTVVVVLGILIALSIDSYKEDYKQFKQWRQFSAEFIRQAKEEKPNYEGSAQFYEQKNTEIKKLLENVFKGNVDKNTFEKTLQSLSHIQSFYPDDIHYKALVASGNEYLLKNKETLKTLGEYYNFKLIAEVNLQMYSDHVMPKYLNFLEDYYSKKIDLKKDKIKIIFFLRLYEKFNQQNIDSYKNQLKNTEAMLKALE